MRTITLEEHYASDAFLGGPGRKLKEQAERLGGRAEKLFEQLCDLGDKRLAAYVVPRALPGPTAPVLKRWLKDRMP